VSEGLRIVQEILSGERKNNVKNKGWKNADLSPVVCVKGSQGQQFNELDDIYGYIDLSSVMHGGFT
jgi:hypothetical protein